MKRFCSDDVVEIKEIYPLLFWKRCKYCNEEFKLENGYEITRKYIGFRNQRNYTWKYCCSNCANTKEDVVTKFSKPKEKIVYKNKIILYY